jgi:hypothetical protein
MLTPAVADRVAETTSTTGVGPLSLNGAQTRFRTFVAAIGNGKQCQYTCVHRTADEWEIGVGTVTDGAPDTLSRDRIIASSNGGAAVNFTAGLKDVFVSQSATRLSTVREHFVGTL